MVNVGIAGVKFQRAKFRDGITFGDGVVVRPSAYLSLPSGLIPSRLSTD